jgi:hypothetical protein
MLCFILKSIEEIRPIQGEQPLPPIMILALFLFVFWIFTNNHYSAMSSNDFAFFANGLY